jgi:hypothetical protein
MAAGGNPYAVKTDSLAPGARRTVTDPVTGAVNLQDGMAANQSRLLPGAQKAMIAQLTPKEADIAAATTRLGDLQRLGSLLDSGSVDVGYPMADNFYNNRMGGNSTNNQLFDNLANATTGMPSLGAMGGRLNVALEKNAQANQIKRGMNPDAIRAIILSKEAPFHHATDLANFSTGALTTLPPENIRAVMDYYNNSEDARYNGTYYGKGAKAEKDGVPYTTVVPIQKWMQDRLAQGDSKLNDLLNGRPVSMADLVGGVPPTQPQSPGLLPDLNVPSSAPQGKQLDANTAHQYLKAAGGDNNKARAMAAKDGYAL